jgi:hypothetical protein
MVSGQWPKLGAAYSMCLLGEAEAEYHSPMSGADDYIIEFTKVGASVKVTAIDPQTMTEVSIVGAAGYSQEFLSRQAVKKLQYVLSKNTKNNA